ncbi:hypothetical protein [Actinoplanes sp. NPDC049802]|uniref:hypothetical protein n=1 Tax=Actinoplanes sp. NPDC049802 TaxID=3154742 RepID=UPI0033D94F8F
MTRPEEPFDDRTMPLPADPWKTVDGPVPTVRLGDPTAFLGDPGRTAHLGPPAPAGQPTVRTHQEVRFGPGVPTAPAAAPAWPRTPGAGRPRLRRLVSVVSSLLTLALVVVVGYHVWQRLSPLEVESASVAVPEPAGNRCDVTVGVVATVRTNGRSGVIRYQWLRSGELPGDVLTEEVGSGRRTVALTLKWTFNGVGATTETATVNIIEPAPLQAGTEVAYRCRRR